MFSRFFIYRPVFAAVISLAIVIIGSVAMVTLPVARYPDIAPPTVQVEANYPGANAATVAETVAAPIEEEVNGVENMLFMSSTSSSDGNMVLTITFEVGTDVDMAAVLVQNRVAVAEPRLPEEARRQGVTTQKKSTDIAAIIGIYSPDESLDPLFLNNYTNTGIKDRLSRVKGVGGVSIFGAGDYGMRVWLDPEQLRARGLTTTDVVSAIQAQNMQVAAGQIGQPPVPVDQDFQYTVTTRGRLVEPEEFANIIVRTGADGALVRVRDVATVELGAKSYSFYSRYLPAGAEEATPCATIMVYQLPGSNLIELVDGLRRTLAEMSGAFPAGLDYRVSYDATDVVRASLREVVITLFMTLVLVVLTVFVFLQSFRATIIPVITIPVSLIGTFAVMAALGFTINQLTLFGLVLVIGIVVDDAIVVVENVTRHLDAGGMTPKEAATKAMAEVSGPVVATTLVLLAVFLPTAFLPGITGQLNRQFALTIAIATVFSSINALTLSPAVAGILMRPSSERPLLPFRVFNRLLDTTTTVYGAIVSGAIRIAIIGVLAFAGLAAVAALGFMQLPSGFVPQEDEGYTVANVMLPDGASLDRTQGIVEEIERIVAETPGVRDAISITGYSVIAGTRTSSSATFFITFDPWDDRTTAELSQGGILRHLNGRIGRIREAIAMAFPLPSLPGLGNSGGMALQLQDRGGAGYTALAQAADEFVAAGNAQAGITGMFTPYRANVPQLFVDIDREQVMTLGIPLEMVFGTLQAFLGGAYVNDFNMFGRTFQVWVQADSQFRARPQDIERLEVRNAEGAMIPLSTVLAVRETFGPEAVTRHNVYPSAKVTGNAAPGFSSGDALEIVESMAQTALPPTMGFEWTEISFQQKAASTGVGLIYALAVIFVYLVLAAQYESWTVPLAVILAVPTALLGAVAAMFARGLPSDVYAQIGLVLLIGLASKSAILIVEFAKELRDKEKKSLFDATVAASKLRFRAILMTALSFILGVVPLVVASGAGAASRQALGTVVFGGMVVSTVLSVVTVPLLYYVISRVVEPRTARTPPATEDAPDS